jgi:hypothetical protein
LCCPFLGIAFVEPNKLLPAAVTVSMLVRPEPRTPDLWRMREMKTWLVLLGCLWMQIQPVRADDAVAEITQKATVTFTARRASLKNYLAEMQSKTGITVVIDRPSLQKQGISINQTFAMPADQIVVKDALDLMVERVAFTNPGTVLWKIDEAKNAVVIFGK